jgi:hypothetical protein
LTVTSKKASHRPRVSSSHASSPLDRPRVPARKADVPARKMNTGAQKCVIQRVRKIPGVVVLRSVGSRSRRSDQKSRT